MATFVADKFNPRTDPDRPKRGSIILEKGVTYVVRKVSYTTVNRIIRYQGAGADLNGLFKIGDFDARLYKLHITRPAVIWIAWCNKLEEKS